MATKTTEKKVSSTDKLKAAIAKRKKELEKLTVTIVKEVENADTPEGNEFISVDDKHYHTYLKAHDTNATDVARTIEIVKGYGKLLENVRTKADINNGIKANLSLLTNAEGGTATFGVDMNGEEPVKASTITSLW